MTISPEQLWQREAEQADFEQRNEQRARFQPPTVIPKPCLMDRLRERFEWRVNHRGSLEVIERDTGHREVFICGVVGAMGATCWMIERMKATT